MGKHDLKNKTILVISPQAWGKMFLSKHHYAVELSKRGNKVLFLNPPVEAALENGRNISVKPSDITDHLYFIDHRISFPYKLKFHALPLFHWLMGSHIKKLLAEIGPIDIVWSFDLGCLYPFRLWGKQPLRIFHPVDEPLNKVAFLSEKGAQYIFSVTHEILNKYAFSTAPGSFINHGVSAEFIAGNTSGTKKGDLPVRVGFAGNLLRSDIDRDMLLQIIEENKEVVFECWGSYKVEHSNIGGEEDMGLRSFIDRLQAATNVVLHGPVPVSQLATAFREMDAFLICYDVERDQSKGTNYHKIIEFLGSGKVIVSNNVTTYQHEPDLIQMVSERTHNKALPGLFSQVIQNLSLHNSAEKRAYRIAFAADNTYPRQIERIEALLNGNG